MILLDTNAIIWLLLRHRRTRRLEQQPRLHVSPASILELQLLIESGRLTLAAGRTLRDIVDDPRWRLDEPPPGAWFERAGELAWTRDPFDRLIVGHALLRRWKLATGDVPLADRLRASERIVL